MSSKQQKRDYKGKSPGKLRPPLKNQRRKVKNDSSVKLYTCRSLRLSTATSRRSVGNSQASEDSASPPSNKVYSTMKSNKHTPSSAGKRYVRKFSVSPKIVLRPQKMNVKKERPQSPKTKSLSGTTRYGKPNQRRSKSQTSPARPNRPANTNEKRAVKRRVDSPKMVGVKLDLSKGQRKGNDEASALKIPLVLLERLPASIVCGKSPIRLSSLQTWQSAAMKREQKTDKKTNLQKSLLKHRLRKLSSVTYSATTPYRDKYDSPSYGLKRSAVKAVPKFSDIHNKIFAKSESLLDARTRLEIRHTAFSAHGIRAGRTKVSPKKRNLSATLDKSTNGSGNRVGVKLRRSDATDLILRKRNLFTSAKNRQEERTVLKGVRTNRRFDLQLKFRKIDC